MTDAGATTVLQSFPTPRPTTNPYIVMLNDALQATPGLEVLTFSWRTALLGHYDVFHAHWPEILVNGHSPAKKLARQLLSMALFARLAATRTPVVRTLHNLERPSGITRRENALLALFERMTDLYVLINPVGEAPGGKPSVRILHGHYRDWYARFPQPETIAGRVGYFGLIRRYKGVEDLVQAFQGLKRPGVSMRIGGKPSTDEQRAEIEAAAAGDERTSTTLRFLDDAELVELARHSQLVVLPYRHMHNSGTALATLSLDRPVLVPDNEANRALAREVGAGWVHTFTGAITADDLDRVLEATADARSRSERPDLSAREWDECGIAHRDAYRSLSRARGLRRR